MNLQSPVTFGSHGRSDPHARTPTPSSRSTDHVSFLPLPFPFLFPSSPHPSSRSTAAERRGAPAAGPVAGRRGAAGWRWGAAAEGSGGEAGGAAGRGGAAS